MPKKQTITLERIFSDSCHLLCHLVVVFYFYFMELISNTKYENRKESSIYNGFE